MAGNHLLEVRNLGKSFPGVLATHTGPYLDQPATGRRVSFNGIDFWLKGANPQGADHFTENWVFLDMIHLFNQFGVDLMARMRALAAR